MKSVVLAGVVLLSAFGGLTRIHNHNAALQRGATAYARQEWSVAAAAYKQAAATLKNPDEAVWLNLAHATLRAGRPAEARGYYSRLSTSPSGSMRSVAFQQLAIIAARKADYAQAIGLCRQALLADPANAAARYNYELLRTMLAQPATPPPPGTDGGPGNQPQNSPGPGTKAGTDKPGQVSQERPASNAAAEARPSASGQSDPNQPTNQPGTAASGGVRPGAGAERNVALGSSPGNVRGLSSQETSSGTVGGSQRGGTEAATNAEANLQTQQARLQQMNLSPGQARQLLEALHASEQQYIQQLPRKATKPATKGRPGW
ncbi:tetratricopeptide repeat protein [Hymenobacter sp. UYP22]|uniref:tetratricopeptide repeat protein n=1 Tax=Hymenobacter sp. UYP22 TaxID=3156348 RepID=UPI0033947003